MAEANRRLRSISLLAIGITSNRCHSAVDAFILQEEETTSRDLTPSKT